MSDLTDRRPFSFSQWRQWFVLVAVLFAAGLAVRLYDLDDLPLDFHPTRQLHSALMARGMFYQDWPAALEWQREIAVQQRKLEAVIEPPLMEWLAAQGYRLAGWADLRIPRLYSILFWMVGSIAVLWLALKLSGRDGALVALAFYLVLPYGVFASRSFQPDPLMVALTAWAWLALYLWLEAPSWRRAIFAGLAGGLTILVKPVAVFFVSGAWLGAILASIGLRKAVRSGQVWALAGLAIAPYAAYHIYGVYISGFLQSQFSQRFFPEMWVDPAFYLRWAGRVSNVMGLEWVAAGFFGCLLLTEKRQRGLLFGGWAGYILYCFVFPHHTGTHDYYHLILALLVALSLAPLAGEVVQRLRAISLGGTKVGARVRMAAAVALLLGTVALSLYDTRTVLKRTDYRGDAAFWQGLSERMGRDAKVVALTEDYGARLAYWGWIVPTVWNTLEDLRFQGAGSDEEAVRSQFDSLLEGRDFFLITLFDEFDRQPGLRAMLDQNYPLVEQGARYLMYDLRHPKGAATP